MKKIDNFVNIMYINNGIFNKVHWSLNLACIVYLELAGLFNKKYWSFIESFLNSSD